MSFRPWHLEQWRMAKNQNARSKQQHTFINIIVKSISIEGNSVNVGAGTITCNYDGVKKSKTKIKNNVFIGSNSSLIAPITINENSVIGAGSVITKNVRNRSLALTRSSQVEIKNYKRKK